MTFLSCSCGIAEVAHTCAFVQLLITALHKPTSWKEKSTNISVGCCRVLGEVEEPHLQCY